MELEELKLREFRKTDKDRLVELCNNKKIWDNLRDYIPHPYSAKDAEDFISNCQKEDPVLTFAIEFRGSFTGCIGLVPQKDIYRFSAEIGYWVGEPFWGKGLATRAIQLIVDYGFQQLGMMRIYAGVFDSNKASQKVLEKAGFTFEGISEKAVFKNREFRNEYRYAKVNEIKGI